MNLLPKYVVIDKQIAVTSRDYRFDDEPFQNVIRCSYFGQLEPSKKELGNGKNLILYTAYSKRSCLNPEDVKYSYAEITKTIDGVKEEKVGTVTKYGTYNIAILVEEKRQAVYQLKFNLCIPCLFNSIFD